MAFIPIGVGMMIAVGLNFLFNRIYVRTANKAGGIAPPEARLIMTMLGGCLLPIGVSSHSCCLSAIRADGSFPTVVVLVCVRFDFNRVGNAC